MSHGDARRLTDPRRASLSPAFTVRRGRSKARLRRVVSARWPKPAHRPRPDVLPRETGACAHRRVHRGRVPAGILVPVRGWDSRYAFRRIHGRPQSGSIGIRTGMLQAGSHVALAVEDVRVRLGRVVLARCSDRSRYGCRRVGACPPCVVAERLSDRLRDRRIRLHRSVRIRPRHAARTRRERRGCFSVEWHHEDDSVWYDIRAFSRPHQWPTRLARGFTRRLQRRFARDSLDCMQRAVRAPRP